MNRGPVKLSTMEIILIITLIGSLVLGLWQARQEERRAQLTQERNDQH